MPSWARMRLTVRGVIRVSVTLCRFFFVGTTKLSASFCSGAAVSGRISAMQKGLKCELPRLLVMDEYSAAAAAALFRLPEPNLGGANRFEPNPDRAAAATFRALILFSGCATAAAALLPKFGVELAELASGWPFEGDEWLAPLEAVLFSVAAEPQFPRSITLVRGDLRSSRWAPRYRSLFGCSASAALLSARFCCRKRVIIVSINVDRVVLISVLSESAKPSKSRPLFEVLVFLAAVGAVVVSALFFVDGCAETCCCGCCCDNDDDEDDEDVDDTDDNEEDAFAGVAGD